MFSDMVSYVFRHMFYHISLGICFMFYDIFLDACYMFYDIFSDMHHMFYHMFWGMCSISSGIGETKMRLDICFRA